MNFKDIIKEDFDENSENNDNDDDPDYNLVMRVSAKDSKPKRKPRKKVVKPRVVKVKKEEHFDGDSRKFPCEFCGKDFSKASEKRTHWKKEHVNEKGELLCKDCTQTFKEQNLLRYCP